MLRCSSHALVKNLHGCLCEVSFKPTLTSTTFQASWPSLWFLPEQNSGTLLLRFSQWLIRYFLKTYVYTPSTPCRDVKFCPNIPLGDLSWNSLTEVMWHHQINGFSNSKFWKKLTRKRSRRIGKWLVWQFCLTLWMKWWRCTVEFFSIQIHWEVMSNFEFRDEPRNLNCS